jgi:hypothetical protein
MEGMMDVTINGNYLPYVYIVTLKTSLFFMQRLNHLRQSSTRRGASATASLVVRFHSSNHMPTKTGCCQMSLWDADLKELVESRRYDRFHGIDRLVVDFYCALTSFIASVLNWSTWPQCPDGSQTQGRCRERFKQALGVAPMRLTSIADLDRRHQQCAVADIVH